MKALFNKFKQSENYSVFMLIVVIALIISAVWRTFVLVVTAVQLAEWSAMGAGSPGIGVILPVLVLLFTVLAVVFTVQAVISNNKMIIGSIVSLAMVLVLTSSILSLICILACGFWFGKTCQIARR